MSTISGGIKFFSKSLCLVDDAATNTASSGDMVSDFCIDKNPLTFWNSVGSDDTVTETIDIRFTTADITRLLLLNHNFKQYTVQYWTGSAWADFTNISGLDGAIVGGISETAYAYDSSYYEFSSVSTSLIRVSILKTQTANQEKSLCQIIATTELGTLQGYPLVSTSKHSRNGSTNQSLSGKYIIVKSFETLSFKLDFKTYPSRLTADLDLIYSLFDTNDPFLVWLCGGRQGTTYFPYTKRGFRLRDCLQMQIQGDVPSDYNTGIYSSQVNASFTLVEHV